MAATASVSTEISAGDIDKNVTAGGQEWILAAWARIWFGGPQDEAEGPYRGGGRGDFRKKSGARDNDDNSDGVTTAALPDYEPPSRDDDDDRPPSSSSTHVSRSHSSSSSCPDGGGGGGDSRHLRSHHLSLPTVEDDTSRCLFFFFFGVASPPVVASRNSARAANACGDDCDRGVDGIITSPPPHLLLRLLVLSIICVTATAAVSAVSSSSSCAPVFAPSAAAAEAELTNAIDDDDDDDVEEEQGPVTAAACRLLLLLLLARPSYESHPLSSGSSVARRFPATAAATAHDDHLSRLITDGLLSSSWSSKQDADAFKHIMSDRDKEEGSAVASKHLRKSHSFTILSDQQQKQPEDGGMVKAADPTGVYSPLKVVLRQHHQQDDQQQEKVVPGISRTTSFVIAKPSHADVPMSCQSVTCDICKPKTRTEGFIHRLILEKLPSASSHVGAFAAGGKKCGVILS